MRRSIHSRSNETDYATYSGGVAWAAIFRFEQPADLERMDVSAGRILACNGAAKSGYGAVRYLSAVSGGTVSLSGVNDAVGDGRCVVLAALGMVLGVTPRAVDQTAVRVKLVTCVFVYSLPRVHVFI